MTEHTDTNYKVIVKLIKLQHNRKMKHVIQIVTIGWYSQSRVRSGPGSHISVSRYTQTQLQVAGAPGYS